MAEGTQLSVAVLPFHVLNLARFFLELYDEIFSTFPQLNF